MQVTYHNSNIEERYTDIPVRDDSSGMRCILYITMPVPVVGEIWDIEAEIHVTNDDLRARGYGLHLTTEIRVGYDTSNTRDGFSVADPNGSFNVGVEAHHGLINRRAILEWTADRIESLPNAPVIKFMIWAGSTQARSSDRCEISPRKGQLKCLRFIP